MRRQREKHDEIIAKREESERAKKEEEEKKRRETEENKSATEERLERLEREAREELGRREKIELELRRVREIPPAAPPPPAQPATSIPITDDSFDEDPPASVRRATEPTADGTRVRPPKSRGSFRGRP